MRTFCFSFGLFLSFLLIGCPGGKKKDEDSAEKEIVSMDKTDPITISPIQHATMVLEWNNITIYVDPVGGGTAFGNHNPPDLILITDIHGDHFDLETLEALDTRKAKIMVPQVVADAMPEAFTPQIDVLNNGDTKERYGITVEAFPMYNLREEALKFHVKGRGNGYILNFARERVYISGDTEDIPEMRALKNITKAFVCMNLPYTMTVESAADAVITFAPKAVYPYHYKGTNGYSDVRKFKRLVQNANPEIEVNLLNWYKS